jgi:hypothetical protein
LPARVFCTATPQPKQDEGLKLKDIIKDLEVKNAE